jgi:hypothetical protein
MNEAGQLDLRARLDWNTDALIALKILNNDMQTAAGLAAPDYTKQFLIYVANRCERYAAAVLMQETCVGRRKKPTAIYCSTKLNPVAQGYPLFYQRLAALHYSYDKVSTITMGYPVTIHTHHKIVELIEQGTFVLTNARTLKYMTLLTYPDVSIKICTIVNSAERVPLEYEGKAPHCVAESPTFTKLCPDLESIPLIDREGVDLEKYFVDGSCYKDYTGNHGRYAVVRKQGKYLIEETF